jgi:hypothetical protein
MLIGLQFPLADSREFVSTYTGKLNRPAWPSPEPGYEFVRSFGSIQTRKRGGLLGWVGENEICEADRALRFDQFEKFRYTYGPRRARKSAHVSLRCAFRRFFFDGLAVGKFETGIYTKVHYGTKLDFSSVDTRDFLLHVLETSVTVNDLLGEDRKSPLGQAGKLLAQSYMVASTTTSRDPLIMFEDWWVQSGPPLLFVIAQSGETIALPPRSKVVTIPSFYEFQLVYCLVPFAGKQVRMWMVKLHPKSDLVAARTLRLYLLRLNAEHECLRLVLRQIENERISISRGTEESEALQYYLNQATRRINRWESRSEELISGSGLSAHTGNGSQGEVYPEVAEIARSSEDLINPGRRHALLDRLRHAGIRKNVLRKMETYTDQWKQAPSGKRIVQIFGDVERMSGDFNVSGQNQQIGAVGSNAHVHHVNVNQKWSQVREDIDLPKLAQELSLLLEELQEEASNGKHYIALGEVARAEEAAKSDDGPRALEHLAKAGKWALDVATNIGTTVAAAAIKVALGLP